MRPLQCQHLAANLSLHLCQLGLDLINVNSTHSLRLRIDRVLAGENLIKRRVLLQVADEREMGGLSKKPRRTGLGSGGGGQLALEEERSRRLVTCRKQKHLPGYSDPTTNNELLEL